MFSLCPGRTNLENCLSKGNSCSILTINYCLFVFLFVFNLCATNIFLNNNQDFFFVHLCLQRSEMFEVSLWALCDAQIVGLNNTDPFSSLVVDVHASWPSECPRFDSSQGPMCISNAPFGQKEKCICDELKCLRKLHLLF